MGQTTSYSQSTGDFQVSMGSGVRLLRLSIVASHFAPLGYSEEDVADLLVALGVPVWHTPTGPVCDFFTLQIGLRLMFLPGAGDFHFTNERRDILSPDSEKVQRALQLLYATRRIQSLEVDDVDRLAKQAAARLRLTAMREAIITQQLKLAEKYGGEATRKLDPDEEEG